MPNAQLKQGQPSSKTLLFSIWSCLVVVIISGLMLEDRFFAVAGMPVALLKTSSNGVTFRSEDDVKWKNVGKKQGFFDGDRVATGPSSSATVEFGEGRFLEMTQDTIIAISSIRETSGNSFIINLVKGGIKPIVPSDAKHALVVMSGTSTFIIEPGEERGFAKPIGGALHEFSAKEKFPVHSKKPDTDHEKFTLPVTFVAPAIKDLPPEEPEVIAVSATAPQVIPTPSPAAEPTPKTKPRTTPKPIPTQIPVPKSKVDLTTLIPTIIESSVAPMYMTLADLNSARPQALDIRITVPRQAMAGYSGFVEVSSGTVKKDMVIASEQARFMIPAEVLKSGLKGVLGAIPCTIVVLQAGVKAGAGADPSQRYMSEKKTETKICSISEARARLPLKIGMTPPTAPITDTKLFAAPARAAKYPLQIIVTKADDYLKLLPYIRSATAFQVERAGEMSTTGVFSVASGKVVSELRGEGLTAKIADKFLDIFGHSFVFKGNRTLIQDVSHLDLDGFKQWITQNTDKGKKVYIRAKSTFVPISRDFMDQREEVAAFVKKASGTIFLDKVEIIAYK